MAGRAGLTDPLLETIGRYAVPDQRLVKVPMDEEERPRSASTPQRRYLHCFARE